MPGYQLLELRHLRPNMVEGIEPYENKMGLLDFLREITQDPFPFPKFYRVQILGLEDVLFAARPQEEELALKIQRILRSAAQNLEKKLVEIQIVFRGRLVRGESLWVEYRNAKLPIGHIFGSPIRQTDASRNQFYKKSFSLTNGVT
ncbi:MAG: hypothetical protein JRI84_07100 [Deltaproteobacteria bacterium]|nr:hypothetical protein [Deltaproteobacteria bacterium]